MLKLYIVTIEYDQPLPWNTHHCVQMNMRSQSRLPVCTWAHNEMSKYPYFSNVKITVKEDNNSL